MVEEWELRRDGDEFWHGYCSAVLPVRTAEGAPAVLKVSFDGDDESAHEALALQTWGGHRAVRLLRADPRRRALLLERLGRRDLGDLPVLDACAEVAGLYGALHVPAPPRVVPALSSRRDGAVQAVGVEEGVADGVEAAEAAGTAGVAAGSVVSTGSGPAGLTHGSAS